MININLLPPEIKVKIKQAKNSANVFSICLVIVFLVAISSVIFSSVKDSLLLPKLDDVNTQIKNETSKLNSFTELEEQAAFLNDRAELAQKVESQKAVWSQIIQELSNSVPSNVQFVTLSSDLVKAPNFILQGKTTTEREAIKFKEKLENSSFFKDVAFKSSSITNENESKSEQLQFSLEFNLENRSSQKASNTREVNNE